MLKEYEINPGFVGVPGAKNVLLVEDNPLFQQKIYQAIEKSCPGSWVAPCGTGRGALEILANPVHQFDLVLVDLGLPDIDGLEVISAARELHPQAPVMVITAITSEETLMSAIRVGAQGYILKRDYGEAMSKAITEVLQGNFPISTSMARSLFRMAGAPDAASKDDKFKLSPRESETLLHISRGYSYAEVADIMGIALSTVQSNVRIIYRKLETNTRMQAVLKARQAGIL